MFQTSALKFVIKFSKHQLYTLGGCCNKLYCNIAHIFFYFVTIFSGMKLGVCICIYVTYYIVVNLYVMCIIAVQEVSALRYTK